MPWTLYKYILRELIKLMAISVAVLVAMISFAAAIKPMSDGLLSPAAMLKFVGYSAPTMLGFALPFAGAFASTLVFTRMAADNEVLACSASGLSYTRILAPVAALGLVLTMGLFYLSNFVVPGFYRMASQTLETDMMSIMVTQLNQNRPFKEIPGYVLYADNAVQMPAPPETGATRFIQLTGVAVGELDELDRVRADSTAKIANILLFQDDQGSRVTLKLLEAMRYRADVGELEYISSLPIGPETIPSLFDDDPKFRSWPELRQLNDEPERYDEVREAKGELAREVAAAELRTSIREYLKANHGRDGVVLKGSLENYLIHSPSVRTVDGALRLESRPGRPVTIQYPAEGPFQRRIEAESGSIEIDPGKRELQPSASIELRQVRIFRVPGTEPMTETPAYTQPGLGWPTPLIADDIESQPLSALQSAASIHYGKSRNVDNAGKDLDRNILKLGRKIISQLHERAASALTCLMLLVFGAVLAMHLKGHMPLVVFFWSFMLAIISIIIINTGQNLASSTKVTVSAGLTVLWAGNAGMALAILIVYRRLARN
jgi:lipopolysaccharide export system permease protein